MATEPNKYSKYIDGLGEETLQEIEADSYWCMTKMMESVMNNYTKGFGGLQEAYKEVEEKLKRVDPQLHSHFMK